MWMGLCFSCIEWLYPISILSRFQPFLWFMCIFWCQTDRRLNFSLYFCAGLPSPCYKFVKVRRALSRWQNKAAHAVLSMAEPWNGKAVQGGYRVGKGGPDILKAFTRRCVWDSLKSSTFLNHVLNVATVDVPGVITSLLRRPCKHRLYPFGHN